MKRLLFLIIVVLSTLHSPLSTLRAQTDPILYQHSELPAFYNPGAAGGTEYLRIRGAARLQWLGIENAPKSFFVVADSPLQFGKTRIGLGVNMMQESIGLFSNLIFNVQAAYKFKALKGEFSVGVQGGYFTSNFKGSEVYIPDDDDYHEGSDTAIPQQDLTGNSFDLSAGVTYTHKYFTLGISGLHLLNPSVNLRTEGSESNESEEYQTELRRSLYFTAHSNIPLKNTLFELQPSLLATTDFSLFSFDVSMRARYNKFLTFGVGYRYDDSVYAMIGAEFKNFILGYSYGYPLSAIAKATAGSHELIVGYRLKLDFSGKNRNKHRSIRIM